MSDLEELGRRRLIAVVRLEDPGRAVAVAEALVEGGVRFVEVTLEREGAMKALARVVRAVGSRAVVGAGTVRRRREAARAVEAGARFLLSPDVRPSLIEATLELGALSLPGAFTPSEVALAERAGASAVKLFPASTGGLGHLEALRGPFPTTRFVPTGGVDADSAASWLAAGAFAVALGGSLVARSGDLEGLVARARAAVAATQAP